MPPKATPLHAARVTIKPPPENRDERMEPARARWLLDTHWAIVAGYRMYCPAAFNESNPEELFQLIEAYSFATVISWADAEPMVSHVPLVLDRAEPGRAILLGHFAKGNRHWQQFDGQSPALAIFQGPHGYISPAWYETTPSVPTWNYAVVHVRGTARITDAEGTEQIVHRLVEKFEGSRSERWSGNLPQEFVRDELHGIVGFQIEVQRISGKFKLSQNRIDADREGALAGLEREPDTASQELAAFSRRYLERKSRA